MCVSYKRLCLYWCFLFANLSIKRIFLNYPRELKPNHLTPSTSKTPCVTLALGLSLSLQGLNSLHTIVTKMLLHSPSTDCIAKVQDVTTTYRRDFFPSLHPQTAIQGLFLKVQLLHSLFLDSRVGRESIE